MYVHGQTGVLAIFAWRIFAKFLLHRILPPTFRFLSQLVTLPHRRFYTPATDYKNVPFSPDLQGRGSGGLRAIPSVLDLPGMVELEVDEQSALVGTATSRTVRWEAGEGNVEVKFRAGKGAVEKQVRFADTPDEEERGEREEERGDGDGGKGNTIGQSGSK